MKNYLDFIDCLKNKSCLVEIDGRSYVDVIQTLDSLKKMMASKQIDLATLRKHATEAKKSKDLEIKLLSCILEHIQP